MSHAESIYEKLQRWCKMGSDLIWRIIYFPTSATVGLWCGRIPEKIDSDFHTCLKCELQKCARNSIMAFWAKGQLISKGLFGFFNSPKKRTKNFCPRINIFKLVFFENWRHWNFLSRLTDLYQQDQQDKGQ